MDNLEKLLRIEKIVTEKGNNTFSTGNVDEIFYLKEYLKVLIEIEKEYTD